MASLIPCPHCGPRAKEVFKVRGAATPRPAPGADAEAWFDHVYLRDNPRGALDEFWHHGAGCRRWLGGTRDTADHTVLAVQDAADWRRMQQERAPA